MTLFKWCILEPNISQYSNMFNQSNTNVIFNDYFLIRYTADKTMLEFLNGPSI